MQRKSSKLCESMTSDAVLGGEQPDDMGVPAADTWAEGDMRMPKVFKVLQSRLPKVQKKEKKKKKKKEEDEEFVGTAKDIEFLRFLYEQN